MRTYHQLTQGQRYQIYALLKMEHSQVEIAAVLGVHRSTVSRELKRNCGGAGYRPQQAERLARARRRKGVGRIRLWLWHQVESLLRQDGSPEQIAERLKKERQGRISPAWIYYYVRQDRQAGGDLYRHLRRRHKPYKRSGMFERWGQLQPGHSIDERPAVVQERQRLGDWEVDTLLGKGSRTALVTLSERKSRFTLLGKVSPRNAQTVCHQIQQVLWPCRDNVLTLTADRGKEFAAHEQIAQALQLHFYFAHPGAAWERGTNENTNGLLRQYFPKRSNFQAISDSQLLSAMTRLNLRPRKCLAFLTPFEVFFNCSVALTT